MAAKRSKKKKDRRSTAPKPGRITWLHLSDAHLCPARTGWQADRILEKLKEDFQQLQHHYPHTSLRPDFIFFHGHEHGDWVEPLGEDCILISAGACYGGTAREMGYNLVQAGVESGRVNIMLRQYDPQGEGWTLRPIHRKAGNGIWKVRLKINPPDEPEPEPEPEPAPPPRVLPGSPESRGVFGRSKEIAAVVGRCLLTPDSREENYFLHGVVRELTLPRIPARGKE